MLYCSQSILPLSKVSGLTLAADVYAKFDIPAFAQSSMDGYAFNFRDKNVPLSIQNKIAAGDSKSYTISDKEAARIFTGAPLPSNADTVVMQEKVTVQDGNILIKDDGLQKGDYVRDKGAEIKSGEIALQAQTFLTPPAIGFLAAIGIAEVSVYPPPLVTVIITGNELQQPGKELLFGQVYESNSFALSAALRQSGIENIELLYAEDKPDVVQETLEKALENSDLVLLTGGISVGDYDYVLQATEKCDG